MTTKRDISRDCFYFDSDGDSLFAWMHTPKTDPLSVAAVVCNPLGVEYMSGHRSMRHLADELASAGISTLRFDYARTGDSSGGEFRGVSVSGLVRNVRDAVCEARQQRPHDSIAVVGIGLGGSLAALASQFGDFDRLVMWNPTISGKRFVREQILLSDVVSKSDNGRSSQTDVAGIVLSPALQDEFRAIDLTALDYRHLKSVLLVNRRDAKPSSKLTEAMESAGVTVQTRSEAGYAEMMAQPTDTVVPTAAFRQFGSWISSGGAQSAEANAVQAPLAEPEPPVTRLPAGDHCAHPLMEFPVHFGPQDRLFGIVTTPEVRDTPPDCKLVYVFLNCGSEHHAGPHRMYTILARRCAGRNSLAFRFDIEGIGDSISTGRNDDNNPYSPVALDDIGDALAFLEERYGCQQFVLAGICAGAYHAFKATARCKEYDIVDSILVNPLVFEWNYEDPEDHLRLESHTYRKSVRSMRNWRRLILGDINYRRLLRSIATFCSEYISRQLSTLKTILTRVPSDGLAKELDTIKSLNRTLTVLLSEDDPGLQIMKLQAPRETRNALNEGWLSVHEMPGANHGLSKKYMQDQLIDFFVERFELPR